MQFGAEVHVNLKTESEGPKHVHNRKSVAVATQRAVFNRDRCSRYFDAQTGRVCGSSVFQNFDHVCPVWDGGGDEVANLRMLCSAYNQWIYRKQAGVFDA